MITYRQADHRDMENIIDFINMVFSMLRVPHNFEEMLPKVYDQKYEKADIHVVAEDEEGRLCGCLGMYTFPLKVGATTLKVGYLGSMAVHKRARGQGVMGELMNQQIRRASELELDMIVLGGQRQRYQYSGFETVGHAYCYTISRSNVRHVFANVDSKGICFRQMTAEDTSFALDLYNQQPVCGARSADNFLDSLQSYRNAAWIIEKDGSPVGYLCASSDHKNIEELVIASEEDYPAVIKAWVSNHSLINVHVTVAPHDRPLNTLLSHICEGYSIVPNCMLRIMNHTRVIAAYMELQNRVHPLCDGHVSINWDGVGLVDVSVVNSGISVSIAGIDDSQPKLNDREAVQLLFGANRFAAPACAAETPTNWFPLPLCIGCPDSF